MSREGWIMLAILATFALLLFGMPYIEMGFGYFGDAFRQHCIAVQGRVC